MDIEQNLILIKDKKSNTFVDRTDDISSIHSRNSKTCVCFRPNSREYGYSPQNVKWLSNPSGIDPAQHNLWHYGQELIGTQKILLFSNGDVQYYRVFSGPLGNRLYDAKEIRVTKNSLSDITCNHAFSYFSELSRAVGIETEDNTLLGRQFEGITSIPDDSVLALYLNPAITQKHLFYRGPLIFPFGCNSSQIRAVSQTFQSSMSVIEGPPGTGKTQTILNIIANAVINKKSVAVVSNNNTAIENVLDKLKAYSLDFLVASLGRKSKRDEFFEQQSGRYPDLAPFYLSQEGFQSVMKRVAENGPQLVEMFNKQNYLAWLKNELGKLELEMAHFNKFFPAPEKLKHRKYTHSKTAAYYRAQHQLLAENGKSFSILTKVLLSVWHGIGSLDFFDKDMPTVGIAFSHLYYTLRKNELRSLIHTLEKELRKFNVIEKSNEFVRDSLKYLQATLMIKYCGHTSREKFSRNDLQSCPGRFMNEYPVVLSTTHSLRDCLKNYLYDYVIIDEASQSDLLTGVLAFSCARNVVIVGDLKQLPNIVDSNTKGISQKIFSSYQLPTAYSYAKHNILSSVLDLFAHIPRTLLREHYRCHPKIIEFCNQRFYENQLVILTKDNGEHDVLQAVKTVKGSHARGHYNQRQIDEIKKQVLPELLNQVNPQEIGIISPYRDQKESLEKDEQTAEFEIQTVHKFQGREKEAIIITTVDNEITKFTDNPQMLNVAVSRAKKRLRVVVSENEETRNTNYGDLLKYIRYNGGEILSGKVRSTFDLLYKGYEDDLKKILKKTLSSFEFESENLIFLLLEKITKKAEFSRYDVAIHTPLFQLLKESSLLTEDEIMFIKSGLAHADFTLFNRLDKSLALIVEVDGYDNHANDVAQIARDQLKDSILTKYQIPFIRLRTNESNEEHRIIEALRGGSAAIYSRI